MRQARPGHASPEATPSHARLVSADDRRVSAQLGELMQGKSNVVVLERFGANNENGLDASNV